MNEFLAYNFWREIPKFPEYASILEKTIFIICVSDAFAVFWFIEFVDAKIYSLINMITDMYLIASPKCF